MRNRWGIDVRRGFYVWGTGPRGGRVEGRVQAIDTRSDFARAYGARVMLEDGQSLGIDDVSQVLPPMTIADDFTVSQNPDDADVDDNPTPRLTRADQPSQRERTTERGTRTKRASERLKRRRALTHYTDVPGVWANPVTGRPLSVPAYAGRQNAVGQRFWYVESLPGHGGVDWGYTPKFEQAIVLSPYWQRRFKSNCDLVGVGCSFLAADEARDENPLTRVKLKSPSQRTNEAPGPRLLKRRRVTAKAPPGFYANPVLMSEGPEYEIHVEAKKSARGQWTPVAMFPRGEVGAAMAKAYARALHGAHPTWAIRVNGPK